MLKFTPEVEGLLSGKKIALFGAGQSGVKAAVQLKKLGVDLHCFVDNDPCKSGARLLGTPVVMPGELSENAVDVIVIGPINAALVVENQLCSFIGKDIKILKWHSLFEYTDLTSWKKLRLDLAQYYNGRSKLTTWLESPQLMSNVVYRFGQYVNFEHRFGLKKLLNLVYLLLNFAVSLMTGIQIWHTVDAGPGLRFAHFGTIVIAKKAVLGHNCIIYHDVTVGQNYDGRTPKIGNEVKIFSGAKVIGGILVGDEAIIGANSLVNKDIPAKSIAVGIPAKVIKSYSETWMQRGGKS